MKSIGIPGDVNTRAAPSDESLRASQPSASPGATVSVMRRTVASSWLSV